MNQILRIPGHWPETPAAAGMGPLGYCGWPRVSQESGGLLETGARNMVLGARYSVVSLLWGQQRGVESGLTGSAPIT